MFFKLLQNSSSRLMLVLRPPNSMQRFLTDTDFIPCLPLVRWYYRADSDAIVSIESSNASAAFSVAHRLRPTPSQMSPSNDGTLLGQYTLAR